MIFGVGLPSYIQLGAHVHVLVPSHVMRDCVFSKVMFVLKRTRLIICVHVNVNHLTCHWIDP